MRLSHAPLMVAFILLTAYQGNRLRASGEECRLWQSQVIECDDCVAINAMTSWSSDGYQLARKIPRLNASLEEPHDDGSESVLDDFDVDFLNGMEELGFAFADDDELPQPSSWSFHELGLLSPTEGFILIGTFEELFGEDMRDGTERDLMKLCIYGDTLISAWLADNATLQLSYYDLGGNGLRSRQSIALHPPFIDGILHKVGASPSGVLVSILVREEESSSDVEHLLCISHAGDILQSHPTSSVTHWEENGVYFPRGEALYFLSYNDFRYNQIGRAPAVGSGTGPFINWSNRKLLLGNDNVAFFEIHETLERGVVAEINTESTGGSARHIIALPEDFDPPVGLEGVSPPVAKLLDYDLQSGRFLVSSGKKTFVIDARDTSVAECPFSYSPLSASQYAPFVLKGGR